MATAAATVARRHAARTGLLSLERVGCVSSRRRIPRSGSAATPEPRDVQAVSRRPGRAAGPVDRFGITTMPTLVVVEGKLVRAKLERPRGCREIETFLAPWLNQRVDSRVEVEAAAGTTRAPSLTRRFLPPRARARRTCPSSARSPCAIRSSSSRLSRAASAVSSSPAFCAMRSRSWYAAISIASVA